MNVWFDGSIKDVDDLGLSCLSHTLHYGTGVFEGIRSYEVENKAVIFRLQDHIDRLLQSAEILGMSVNQEHDEISHAIHEVVRTNSLTNAYIRPLLYYGRGGMGLDVNGVKPNPVHLMVAAWEWESYFSDSGQAGVNAFVSDWKRVFANPSMVQAKAVGHYLNSHMAYSDAIKNGYEEAILIDEDGYIAEGSASNLFVVKDKKVMTPKTTNALKGITRNTAFSLLRDMGYTVDECDMNVEVLLDIDEAFFTGTACEISRIGSINGKKLPGSDSASLTTKLAESYLKLVRMEYKFNDYFPQNLGEWFSVVQAVQLDKNNYVA